jgi:hypothetical protein
MGRYVLASFDVALMDALEQAVRFHDVKITSIVLEYLEYDSDVLLGARHIAETTEVFLLICGDMREQLGRSRAALTAELLGAEQNAVEQRSFDVWVL